MRVFKLVFCKMLFDNKYYILWYWYFCIYFLYSMCVNLTHGYTYYEHSILALKSSVTSALYPFNQTLTKVKQNGSISPNSETKYHLKVVGKSKMMLKIIIVWTIQLSITYISWLRADSWEASYASIWYILHTYDLHLRAIHIYL
jgi:hypothetical protein